MRILLIRCMGLGDVASILAPAVSIYKNHYSTAVITTLTYEAGAEIMQLHPEVDDVITIKKEDWPDDLVPALDMFMRLAQFIAAKNFDLVVNLDTWFMPCFLTQILRDAGVTAIGNHLNQGAEKLFSRALTHQLSQDYFDFPSNYMDSTFPNMTEWSCPWWTRYSEISYPEFYLRFCYGFDDYPALRLPCEADTDLLKRADGRPIVAISTRGRSDYKQYRYSDELIQTLNDKGIFCWSEFDGSVTIKVTLNRLHSSKLIVTVPTSTQWLGRLAGCPSLMLPGPMPPSLLGAEFYPPRQTSCQYCGHEKQCPERRNFDCMDISPNIIANNVVNILAQNF